MHYENVERVAFQIIVEPENYSIHNAFWQLVNCLGKIEACLP